MHFPSGENATVSTEPSCPFTGSPIATPFAVLQNRIVPSHDADTTTLPSGDIVTALTPRVCPLNTWTSLGQSVIPPCRNITSLGNRSHRPRNTEDGGTNARALR